MKLLLDIGNSQIYGGLFENDSLRLQFRKASKQGSSSDEIGLFLRSVLRENGYAPEQVSHVALCSVVPDALHSVRNACRKYFSNRPIFVLQAGAKTGLRIKYKNPVEVGADRIANAIAGTSLYPNKNLVIVDLGTATTFCAINKNRDYLGGIILPGLRISMEVLDSKTAKLPSVEIAAPTELVGRSTVESIQSGLYFGHLCLIQTLSQKIREQYFENKECLVLGTGGFARLFEPSGVFDAHIPELVLLGLLRAQEMNAGVAFHSEAQP